MTKGDQSPASSPRLWRALGLGATALGLAADPAAALSPTAPRASNTALPLIWQAQAESGEAGGKGETTQAGEANGDAAVESGEAGAVGEGTVEAGDVGEGGETAEVSDVGAATGLGEAGEGGEAGALAAENPKVAILTALGLVEGHLWVGLATYRAGQAEEAKTHMKHPGDELYADLEPLLTAQGLPGFAEELTALAEAVEGGGPLAEAEAAYQALRVTISETREAVAGDDPADRFAAMTAVLRTAGEEYAVGVRHGAIANLHEYQDAQGFVQAVRAEAEALTQSRNAAVAGAATDVLTALVETDSAFLGLSPEGGLPADGAAILHGAAARVELAGLSVQ